ncbi:MAG TPA: nucleotidyltransferase [Candidatus Saccharimonadales bacterium]|nr:nucleotidyltransferase [Candidatus Saccharimonadales bacterium]
MGIPDSQLQTWTNQGSVTQSSTTYATIKGALEAPDAGYADQSFKIFLQGSYCNDTNVWFDSDVDIVIRLDSVFHFDLRLITPPEAVAFHTANPGSASYTYDAFKADVMKALTKRFGTAAVTAGEKAITIRADGGRRSADVVVATQFKRFRKFPASLDEVDIGACLFTKLGIRIANYPEQHSKFCTVKHQSTNSRFKPMVRIFKNMRNRLGERWGTR